MNTVVISGGGSGIGRAVAQRQVRDGAHVTIVGRRAAPLEQVQSELGDERVDIAVADVSSVAGVTSVAEQLEASGAACAGVVAAAGGVSPQPDGVTGMDAVRGQWQACFESNVLTAVLLIEALHPALERGGGRVVLLSSVAALRGSGGGPYAAMKAALHGFMYDLARGVGSFGGTANVIAPGFVPDTEFWSDRLTDDSRAERASQTLTGREGTPGEVASLIAWLLGPDGGWVTGQILSPNGGVVLGR